MLRACPTVLIVVLAVGLLVCVPSLAQAADEGKPGILSPRLDLGIWTIVVFALLYVVMRYVKLPGAPAPAFVMMMEGLHKREQHIQHALDEARQAHEEAERLRAQFQAEMAKAHEKVRELMDEARRDAQHTKDEMVNQARKEIQDERDRLRREIEMTRDQALQELWNRTAELATQISSKAIRRSLSTDDHQRLVDDALAELGQAGREYRN